MGASFDRAVSLRSTAAQHKRWDPHTSPTKRLRSIPLTAISCMKPIRTESDPEVNVPTCAICTTARPRARDTLVMPCAAAFSAPESAAPGPLGQLASCLDWPEMRLRSKCGRSKGHVV